MLFTFGVSAMQWTGGLSNDGELILLKNSSGLTIDSVFYDDVNPWPTSADGTGPSLMLCNPNADNAIGSNWQASQHFVMNNAAGAPYLCNPRLFGMCLSAGGRIHSNPRFGNNRTVGYFYRPFR